MSIYIRFILTHAIVAFIGFAAGIYVLPILIAPPAPTVQAIQVEAAKASLHGQFRRDLKGSDLFHWGEGDVAISQSAISMLGHLTPGPDYKLYLSPQVVENKADFIRLKSQMVLVGDVNTFTNFVVPVPASIDVKQYSTVIVWCKAFDQFITATQYK